MPTIAVVAHADKSFGGGLPELRKVLAEAGFADPLWYEVAKSRKAPKYARRAAAEGAGLIMVWGGDGTVQRCIDAVAGTGAVIAILPAGTANLLATNLGVPSDDVSAAVRVGLHGRNDGRRGKLRTHVEEPGVHDIELVDASGTTNYTSAEILGGPTPNPPAKFFSAIWDYPSIPGTALALSFGTDCAIPSASFFFDGTTCNESTALHTKVGWDNVTGVGTPNAQAFADSFNPANAAAANAPSARAIRSARHPPTDANLGATSLDQANRCEASRANTWCDVRMCCQPAVFIVAPSGDGRPAAEDSRS